ncbi:MAG: sulfite exporter TauE/SafE family protein [Chloroflexota bacterium]
MVLILSVLFISALIKSSIGFGESMLAMPLLLLLMDVQSASPLIFLVAASLTVLILITSWKEIDIRAAWIFMLAALVGTPFGVWGLISLPSRWLTAALGGILILAGLHNIFQPKTRRSNRAYWGIFFGFFAGMLSGAYNISGPPTVLYGSIKGWSPEEFRATLQGLFLPVTIIKLFGYGVAGLWTQEVLTYFAFALPFVLFAFWIGQRVHQKMPKEKTKMILHSATTIFGVTLLAQSFG